MKGRLISTWFNYAIAERITRNKVVLIIDIMSTAFDYSINILKKSGYRNNLWPLATASTECVDVPQIYPKDAVTKCIRSRIVGQTKKLIEVISIPNN